MQRVSDEAVASFCKYMEHHALDALTPTETAMFDLRDARARIADLEALVAGMKDRARHGDMAVAELFLVEPKVEAARKWCEAQRDYVNRNSTIALAYLEKCERELLAAFPEEPNNANGNPYSSGDPQLLGALG